MFLVYNFLLIYSAVMLSTHRLNIIFFMAAFVISSGWLIFNVDKKEFKALCQTFKLPIILSFIVLAISTLPVIHNDLRFKFYDFPSRLFLMMPIAFVLYKKVMDSSLDLSKLKKQYALGAILGTLATFGVILYPYFYLKMERPEAFVFVLVFSHMCLISAFQGLSWAIDKPKKMTYLLSGLAIILGIVSCLLSGTRGAWIYIPLLIFVLINYVPIQKRTKRLLFGSAVCSLLVMSFVLVNYSKRVNNLKREIARYQQNLPQKGVWSLTQRFEMLKFGLISVKNKPFFGSSDAYRIKLFKELNDAKKISYYEWHVRPKPGDDIHNTLFNFLTRKGIFFGLLAYLALMFLPFYIFFKSKKAYLKYSAGILSVALFVSSLSFDIFNLHQTYEFYSFFTLTLFMFLKIEQNKKEEPSALV